MHVLLGYVKRDKYVDPLAEKLAHRLGVVAEVGFWEHILGEHILCELRLLLVQNFWEVCPMHGSYRCRELCLTSRLISTGTRTTCGVCSCRRGPSNLTHPSHEPRLRCDAMSMPVDRSRLRRATSPSALPAWCRPMREHCQLDIVVGTVPTNVKPFSSRRSRRRRATSPSASGSWRCRTRRCAAWPTCGRCATFCRAVWCDTRLVSPGNTQLGSPGVCIASGSCHAMRMVPQAKLFCMAAGVPPGARRRGRALALPGPRISISCNFTPPPLPLLTGLCLSFHVALLLS